MRIHIFSSLMMLMCFTTAAQNKGVIYTKDGSVIRGEITSHLPQESTTIRTIDGIEIVIPATSIQKIIISPYESAKSDDKPKPTITPPWPTKRNSGRSYNADPRVAAAGSCIFPGLGQLLNDEPDRAAVFIISNFIGFGLIYKAINDNVLGVDVDGDDQVALPGIVLTTAVWIYAIVDAYQGPREQSNITPIISNNIIGGKVQFQF